MGKRDKYFEKIAEYKERFQNLPTQKLHDRLTSGKLIREAAIALRELIDERKLLEVEESNEGNVI